MRDLLVENDRLYGDHWRFNADVYVLIGEVLSRDVDAVITSKSGEGGRAVGQILTDVRHGGRRSHEEKYWIAVCMGFK